MNKFKDIIEEIKDQYLNDPRQRPWIVGFSGGKDSTLLLQLVWSALKDIELEKRRRTIYVICNNTLVENPKILEYTEEVLKAIEKAAFEQRLPIIVNQTTPQLEDSFWVNLIGKGYPAPNNSFRWCTERLKINPTTKFIQEKISNDGEVIILLGTRSDESSKRAKSIEKHEITGNRLRKHILPKAFVYAPIKNIKTEDVWTYLLQVDSHWGSSNKQLVAIYRNADGGDCPLVLDKSTPSCGNSRFGCWVCTVVQKDKSMEGLIENGEEWLEPLLEIREYLNDSRYDHSLRMTRRRNGMEGIGPYIPEIRKKILEMILIAQKEIQPDHNEVELISYQELVAIQVLWFRDNIFNFSVAEIYNEIFGTNLTFLYNDQNQIQEKKLLKSMCSENPEDYDLINELLDLQKTRSMLMNKRGIQNDFEVKLQQYLNEQEKL